MEDTENPVLQALLETYNETYGEPSLKPDMDSMHSGAFEPDTHSWVTNAPDTINLNPHNSVTSTGYTGNLLSTINSITLSTPHNQCISLSMATDEERNFSKILQDISNKKAVIESVSSNVDTSFTGFGGQIKYTIEVISTYP